MSRSLVLTLAFAACALVVLSGSYYATDVRQKGEIEKLEESRRLAEALNVRAADLRTQEATSSVAAREAFSRWHARYKYIPTELNTADMVEYLEGLTRSGFEQFDLDLAGQQTTPDFSVYTFDVKGIAFFPALYDLVWHLENNREFYRIYDLKIEHVAVNQGAGSGRPVDMVSFTCKLDAYFAGLEGISAPEDSLRPIPVGLLAAHRPTRDVFRPLVHPPATSGGEGGSGEGGATGAAAAPRGLNLETARLVAIIGLESIFDDGRGRHALSEGDEVQNGYIERVDTAAGQVTAVLFTETGAERILLRIGQEGTLRRPIRNFPAAPAPTPAAPSTPAR